MNEPESHPPDSQPGQKAEPVPFNWARFFATLLAPVFLAPIVFAILPAVALFLVPVGGVLCGIDCGRMLAKRAKAGVLVTFALQLVLALACLTMSMVGCTVMAVQY